MKARRKGTNDKWQEVQSVTLADNEWNLIKAEAIEFQHDDLPTELNTYNKVEEEKHWKNVRERTAIAAIQAILTYKGIRYVKDEIEDNVGIAVEYADELVKQLKVK